VRGAGAAPGDAPPGGPGRCRGPGAGGARVSCAGRRAAPAGGGPGSGVRGAAAARRPGGDGGPRSAASGGRGRAGGRRMAVRTGTPPRFRSRLGCTWRPPRAGSGRRVGRPRRAWRGASRRPRRGSPRRAGRAGSRRAAGFAHGPARAPARPALLVAALAVGAAVRPFVAGNGVGPRPGGRSWSPRARSRRRRDPGGRGSARSTGRGLRGYARGDPRALGEWLPC
jgi:hypothetical protein